MLSTDSLLINHLETWNSCVTSKIQERIDILNSGLAYVRFNQTVYAFPLATNIVLIFCMVVTGWNFTERVPHPWFSNGIREFTQTFAQTMMVSVAGTVYPLIYLNTRKYLKETALEKLSEANFIDILL